MTRGSGLIHYQAIADDSAQCAPHEELHGAVLEFEPPIGIHPGRAIAAVLRVRACLRTARLNHECISCNLFGLAMNRQFESIRQEALQHKHHLRPVGGTGRSGVDVALSPLEFTFTDATSKETAGVPACCAQASGAPVIPMTIGRSAARRIAMRLC
jgi:hypothetical protein